MAAVAVQALEYAHGLRDPLRLVGYVMVSVGEESPENQEFVIAK